MWHWRGVLFTAPPVAILWLLIRATGILQPLEWAAFDQLMRMRPLEPTDSRIIVVAINEKDITSIKRWPIEDRLLAKLLRTIAKQKPHAIGLDLARDVPQGEGYQELVKVFRTTPILIGAEKKPDLVDSAYAAVNSDIKPPPILQKLGQVGFINLPLDQDRKVRRGFLSMQMPNEDVSLSMSLQLSLLYLNAQTDPINPQFLENALNPPLLQPNDGAYVNMDNGGAQFIINFRNSKPEFHRVSMMEVLEGKIPPDLFRGKVVLIGVTAVSFRDFLSTSLDGGLWSSRQQTAGVEIHAQTVSHILSTALDGRTTIRVWSDSWEAAWVFLWALIGTYLVWQWRLVNATEREVQILILRSLSLMAVGTLLVGICFVAFNYGWWLPLVPGLLGFISGGALVTSYLALSATKIRTYFSRYLTNEVVQSLLETPEGLRFTVERRKVTILMSDLRGFSTISEKMPPEQVVEILNVFLGGMTEVITRYQGTIDEFIGDAILVLFGAPIIRHDDAERAVACAIAMQKAMVDVNQKLQRLNLPSIEMGIGINTGEVVAGNIGSQSRAKYAVVGNHVNLTARIESYTVGRQILISEATYGEVEHILETNGQMEVEPKGVSQPITIYDVQSLGGKYQIALPHYDESFYVLKQPVVVYLRLLTEKKVRQEAITAYLFVRTDHGALLRTAVGLEPLTNMKMQFRNLPNHPDVYAKVLPNRFIPAALASPNDTSNNPVAVQTLIIRFTTLPPEVEKWLESLSKNSV